MLVCNVRVNETSTCVHFKSEPGFELVSYRSDAGGIYFTGYLSHTQKNAVTNTRNKNINPHAIKRSQD